MKKLVSLAIAVIMIVSVFAMAMPAAAAGTDPSRPASESKVIKVKSSTKLGGSVGDFANAANKNYADNTMDQTATYASDPPKNSEIAAAHQCVAITPMGSKYSVFCEKGSTDPEYNDYLVAELGSGETVESTKIDTVVFAVPAATSKICTLGKPVINNIAVYYSNTEDWKPVAAASATADNADVQANKANFKELFTVTGLDKEDSTTQFVESADGTYRYYEYKLAEPVEAKYLLIGTTISMYSFFTEFAVFSPEEVATTEEQTTAATEPAAPAADTGDNAMIVLAVVGAVAVIGLGISLRRKENN